MTQSFEAHSSLKVEFSGKSEAQSQYKVLVTPDEREVTLLDHL